MSELRALAERQRRTDPSKAVETYQRAVLEARWKLAHTIRHQGDVYAEQNQKPQALPCYEEALTIYQSYPGAPPLDVANAIRAMAAATDRVELWAEARSLYEQCGIVEGVEGCDLRLRELRDKP
ncbi:MAG: tetratricopeptide repeat protein [Bryobacteraceae bacterium]|nr:tetratricopeptide repeat protein [Bryobacteraceae bacterium]